MTLVDTSVWFDHRRRGNARLAAALELGRVAAHPFVLGELACGTMPRRSTTLHLGTHLLAAATLTDTPLWTLDRALRRAAERLHIFGEPEV